MPTIIPGTNIEVPAPMDKGICPGYTGFNSVNIHEIYVAEKVTARRSQIVRGWSKPVIQRLANGDLLASQSKNLRQERNPNYPDADEEAALCRSTDNGITWSEPWLLGIPGRPTQLSALSSGALVLAAGGNLYRSADEGTTWAGCDIDWDAFQDDTRENVMRGFGETNGLTEMPDGSLLGVAFTLHEPIDVYTDFRAYAIRSSDNGRTWGDATKIIETDEVELLLLPDGRLLGFARLDTSYTRDVWGQTGQIAEGGDTMALMKSTDGGRTWTEPKPIGLGAAQIPGFPLLLPDGRLLLIHGNRQFPFGVQAVGSRDLGLTWDLDHPLILAWASWDNYGGHPRSILMPDGSIMTGYYARYFKEYPDTVNGDIVSHCLNWRVPENWPPHRRG